eukprot:204377_1
MSNIAIQIRTGKRSIFIENFDTNNTAKSIKKIVEDKQGIPMKSQRLLYRGKELKDNTQLKNYNIKHNAIILLSILRKTKAIMSTDKSDDKTDQETPTLKAIKKADQRIINIVYGYCRNIQKLLSSKQMIPTQIIDICLLYYMTVEAFHSRCGNKFIQFSDQDKTIYNPKGTGNFDTAYGIFEIDCDDKLNANKIFKWTFYIHNDGKQCNAIGIDETKRKWVNELFKTKRSTVNYCYDGFRPHASKGIRASRYGKKYEIGDTIVMVLNIKQQTLIYYKIEQYSDIDKVSLNEKNLNEYCMCRFDEIITKNVKYCLAINLWKSGKITLIDFQICTHKEIIDMSTETKNRCRMM